VGRGSLSILLIVPQIWFLRRRIRKLVRYPTVYLLSYSADVLGRLLSYILSGAPIVVRQQIELPRRIPGSWRNLAALRRATLVLAGSRAIRIQVTASGIDALKVVVRYPAIDPCFRSLPMSHREGRTTKTVGFVGRLEPEKGPLDAIVVYEACASRHPELRLEIIGSGSLDRDVVNQIRRSRFKDRMSWTPRTDPETLARRLGAIDVILMPSVQEGFGRVAVESMLRGCVVIGFRTGGLPEACGPGGILVDPGSLNEMTLVLNRLLEDVAQLNELRKLGRQHADRVFTAAATPVTEIIRETLGASASRSRKGRRGI
jgi:glycosyltransferase involved in cell wall biosynthesis